MQRFAFVVFRDIESAIRAQAACAAAAPVLRDRKLIVHFGSFSEIQSSESGCLVALFIHFSA